MAETDSEDELPSSWEERVSAEGGNVYYLNHINRSTQWTHPRTAKMKKVSLEFPLGWEKKIENDGRIIFINKERNMQSLSDPRLAFAVEESTNTSSSIRQRFDGSSTALSILHGKDLSGKVSIITGGNSGIGLETAKSLAFHGAEIILACRNQHAAAKAIEALSKEREGLKINFIHLDLSSLRSCKKFCDEVKLQYKHLDSIILNAGVFALPYTTTEDGVETMFQTCHLSHFYITKELSSLLNHESRVISVSSESHRFATLPSNGLTRENLSPSYSSFWSMIQYNNSKLCNVLFAHELARRWGSRGISVFALHPGNMVNTPLSRHFWFYRLLFNIARPFTKSLQQAAATTVFCTTVPELQGLTGIYFNNAYICEPSKLSQSTQLASELWSLSEKMIESVFESYGN